MALLAFSVAMGTPFPDAARTALQITLCATCAGALVGAMVLIPGSGMGLGDAKLCAVLGLWLGYFGGAETAMGIILGFFIGGIVAIALMICHLGGRRQERLGRSHYSDVGTDWCATRSAGDQRSSNGHPTMEGTEAERAQHRPPGN